MAATLVQLSQLIAHSVAELVDICETSGLQIPDLDSVFTPESEAFRKNSGVAKAANNIVAAAFQLVACVLPPQESVTQLGSGHIKTAALRAAIECHVPEILREAGGQGLHADDIAAKTGVDSGKLARLLRVLTNRHTFREIQPDVFVNNRISSVLDTGKSVKDILAEFVALREKQLFIKDMVYSPHAKHDNTDGKNAFIELLVADGPKATSYLVEHMKNPEPYKSPFQRALGTQKNYYEFIAEPNQGHRRRCFGQAMHGLINMDLPDLPLKLFDWSTLPNDALVVDVGGGIGSASRVISKAHPNMKFVVQDAPSVVKDGIDFWNNEDPEALQTGRVRIQAHDFFSEQPITNASMFLLKGIINNWSPEQGTAILSQLRHAATPDTRLLILDPLLVSFTRSDSKIKIESVSGNKEFDPPSILSTGYNSVIELVWSIDISVMGLLDGQAYTVYQINQILTNAGWELIKVIHSGQAFNGVLAKPN